MNQNQAMTITHVHVTSNPSGYWGAWTQLCILPAGVSLHVSPVDPLTIQYASGRVIEEKDNILDASKPIGPFDKPTRIAVRVKTQPYTVTAIMGGE